MIRGAVSGGAGMGRGQFRAERMIGKQTRGKFNMSKVHFVTLFRITRVFHLTRELYDLNTTANELFEQGCFAVCPVTRASFFIIVVAPEDKGSFIPMILIVRRATRLQM